MQTTDRAMTLHVNGAEHKLVLEPRHTLLDALCYDLHLTGTKKVCDTGDCGACTILVDGRAMYACLLLALDGQGRQITTIEGLARTGWILGEVALSQYERGQISDYDHIETSLLVRISQASVISQIAGTVL